ncbi:MAG: ABC transporter permease [Spirochaetes bacterium]|nr:ABC transporter permease [Spirochaetota bacterium]
MKASRLGLKKVINSELILGSFLLLILIIIALWGPYLAPYDLNYSEPFRQEIVNGEETMIFAPEPPSKRHPLGTDSYGYDMLTLLLYGAKYTLGACVITAFIRVFIGLIIALYLGFENKPSQKLQALGGMPALIILVFIFFGITFNSSISTTRLFFIQVFFIAIVGLPGVIIPLQERTYLLSRMQYIDAAHSIGASKFRILFIHIFPFLREDFFSVLVHEMILTLNLIGQLGIFHIFLGGTIMTFSPPLLHSKTNELSGLIGQLRYRIHSQPSKLLIPLAAYLIVLLSFHLISQGIDKNYRKVYAKSPYI